MTKLNNQDLHAPFNGKTLAKVKGHLLRGLSEQAAAATLATDPMKGATPLRQDQTYSFNSPQAPSDYLQFFAKSAAAAGESLTIDVLRNGVSILTAPYVYDSTQAALAGTFIDLPVVAGTTLFAGDLIQVSRTYVAGGGPTPIGPNCVMLEPG